VSKTFWIWIDREKIWLNRSRPPGQISKAATTRDGFLIARTEVQTTSVCHCHKTSASPMDYNLWWLIFSWSFMVVALLSSPLLSSPLLDKVKV
jgi:hypothetical protein